MVLTETGLAKVFQRIKSFVIAQLNSKASAVHTHTSSDITDLPDGLTVDSTLDENSSNAISNSAVSEALNGKSNTGHTHTKSQITDFPTLATVATSGSYSDLSNKPTIPSKTSDLTNDSGFITDVAWDDVSNKPTIPSKTSDLTNDSGFLTSHQSLSDYSTKANTVKSLSISGKTITVTPGSGNAYTLTTQDTVYTHPTTAGNKHIPSGGSSGQFLGWDSDGTAKWVNNPNSDTKNTAGSTDTSSKIFLIGATSQAANPQTYSHDTAYVGTDGCLYSGGTKVLTAHQSLSNYSTLANTIKSLSISGKTITYTKGDNTTGTLTTQDTNTTYSNFVKSGSGAAAGLVPAPSTTAGTTKYLREDGTWQVPPDHTYTVNNATLTIQKNGTNVATFTSNASSNVTANISVPTNNNQLTNGAGYITSSGSCASCTTAGQVSTSVGAGSTKNLIYCTMADNDYCRIMCGGSSNAGYMEIATADDGNEPIYVRQYTGAFGSVTRTLTLLDGSGNTQFPGTVTATTFSGNLTGNCSGSAGSVAWSNVTGKPTIPTVNNATLTIQKNGSNVAAFTANASSNVTANISVPTKTSDLTNDSFVARGNNNNAIILTWNSPTASYVNLKVDSTEMGGIITTSNISNYGFITASNAVPRSGGAVMSGAVIGRTVNNDEFRLDGGTGWDNGASISLGGKNRSYSNGTVSIHPSSGTESKTMDINPNGTWYWTGTACSVSSDSRLKDEIESIPNEILDAWENLEPKQYKYKSDLENDKDTAQVHYGWIAQDVESVIKGDRKTEVQNGLFTHEFWEEQEEISHEETYTEEVETKSGEKQTVTKTRKVIDQPYKAKGDTYGLRYTECLVVECAYLRRENDRLKEKLASLEERLEKLENQEK